MERLIYISFSSLLDLKDKTPLMAASIRRFAGSFSRAPIWVFAPCGENEIPDEIKSRLSALDVRVVPFSPDPDVRRFPFASLAYAASIAESLAGQEADLLVWMLADTIVFNQPVHLALGGGIGLGCRPMGSFP